MIAINGKTLIFTDLHLGLKSASKGRLAICVKVIKSIISHVKQDKIDNILFLGDWHHSRIFLENNVLNVSYKLMQALAKNCKVYLIVGNHDIYMKNSVDVNSLVMFESIPNVTIIEKATEATLNGNTSLLVPWLADFSAFKPNTYDMMFGHFDASHKYLVQSYIEDHSSNARLSEKLQKKINKEIDASDKQENAGDFIGDYVELAKEGGTIFSGHIHGHRTFTSRGRNFILVGDPCQQNLGEKDYVNGFYVLDEKNKYAFHQIAGIPVHFEFAISDVLKVGIEKFDFSKVKGNIIHKIYDIEVSRQDDAKISQKINDLKPYEELLPDYNVIMSYGQDQQSQIESVQLIKKSKLEYISNYIQNIDKKVLEEQKIDPEKLYKVLEEYYQKAVVEK